MLQVGSRTWGNSLSITAKDLIIHFDYFPWLLIEKMLIKCQKNISEIRGHVNKDDKIICKSVK